MYSEILPYVGGLVTENKFSLGFLALKWPTNITHTSMQKNVCPHFFFTVYH